MNEITFSVKYDAAFIRNGWGRKVEAAGGSYDRDPINRRGITVPLTTRNVILVDDIVDRFGVEKTTFRITRGKCSTVTSIRRSTGTKLGDIILDLVAKMGLPPAKGRPGIIRTGQQARIVTCTGFSENGAVQWDAMDKTGRGWSHPDEWVGLPNEIAQVYDDKCLLTVGEPDIVGDVVTALSCPSVDIMNEVPRRLASTAMLSFDGPRRRNRVELAVRLAEAFDVVKKEQP